MPRGDELAGPSFQSLADACFAGTIEEATRAVVEHAEDRKGGYVCFCNVHLLVEARRNPRVRAAMSEARLRFPDGAPVAWLRRRTEPLAARVGGPDLFPHVLEQGALSGLRHFFFGATPRVLARLEQRLKSELPAVQIAGIAAPPFAANLHERESEEFAELVAADPHVAWIGLGAPKQELWMHRFAPLAPHILFLGVGAAFEFYAETKQRAPAWMRASSLEWLHRLAQEPSRLSGRYLTTNFAFIRGVIQERLWEP